MIHDYPTISFSWFEAVDQWCMMHVIYGYLTFQSQPDVGSTIRFLGKLRRRSCTLLACRKLGTSALRNWRPIHVESMWSPAVLRRCQVWCQGVPEVDRATLTALRVCAGKPRLSGAYDPGLDTLGFWEPPRWRSVESYHFLNALGAMPSPQIIPTSTPGSCLFRKEAMKDHHFSKHSKMQIGGHLGNWCPFTMLRRLLEA